MSRWCAVLIAAVSALVVVSDGVAKADVGRPGIVYASVKNDRSNIYVVSDSASPHLLVGGRSNERAPAWSPDGTRVAFDSNRSGNYDIWVLNRTTHHLRRITHEGAYDADPTWSPDGTRLAFVTTQWG
ncbi:MAG: hypothetical protein M3290_02730, partial [Actinomycetota bacterium]|nr:hypothetical protein [Actinomycetota bacterium]